jgi:ElaB/YqjD/DUF883 family membrane-anchored ribosome-binding protein
MTNSDETVTKDKLMDDLNAVIMDAEELLKATASQTGERIAEVRARTTESLRLAKMRLAVAQDAALLKARAAAKATDVYVHENPWKAAGIAAAVGVLVGALISRR